MSCRLCWWRDGHRLSIAVDVRILQWFLPIPLEHILFHTGYRLLCGFALPKPCRMQIDQSHMCFAHCNGNAVAPVTCNLCRTLWVSRGEILFAESLTWLGSTYGGLLCHCSYIKWSYIKFPRDTVNHISYCSLNSHHQWPKHILSAWIEMEWLKYLGHWIVQYRIVPWNASMWANFLREYERIITTFCHF